MPILPSEAAPFALSWLERGPEILRLARGGAPVGGLDDVDHVARVLGVGDGGNALAHQVGELHDVFENVRFFHLAVRADHVRQERVAALRLSQLAPFVLDRLPVELLADDAPLRAEEAGLETAADMPGERS